MIKVTSSSTPVTAKSDAAERKGTAFPDVAKTPSPAGPVPVPYPVTPDSFERFTDKRLGAILGASAAEVPGALQRTPTALASQVGGLMAAGQGEAALTAWEEAVAKLAEHLKASHGDPAAASGTDGAATVQDVDIRELVYSALLESITTMNDDKKSLLEQVQEYNEAGEALSDYLRELAAKATELAASGKPQRRDPGGLVQSSDGRSLPTTIDSQAFAERVNDLNALKESLRKAVAEVPEGAKKALLGRWEENLQGVGDDAQLANVDVQNILQKQQQTLQMMSNISKMLYDTAQSVVRKMGG